MAGNPPEIADQLHAAVSRAVFRVPLGDWVKYALGYKAVVVESLLASLCDIRDGLQMAFQDSPWTRHTYINIEKVRREYLYKDRPLTEADIAVVVLPIGSLGRC
jgi:hypothetical protein